MSKRLFLHVGTNKAGSTSIQFFLNYLNMLDLGYAYLADEYRLGADISSTYKDSSGVRQLVQLRVIKKIKQAPRRNIVISSENFWTPMLFGGPENHPAIVQRIKDFFSFIPTKILIVVRRQDGLAESQYLWNLKSLLNYRESFAGFLQNARPEGFDWNRAVAAYEAAFGIRNISVIPFEYLKRDQSRFARMLLRFLEIDVPDDFAIEFPHKNTGVNQEGVDFLLNLPPHTRTKEEQAILRTYVEREFPGTRGQRPQLFANGDREAFLARYATANRALLARYGLEESIWFE